MQTNDKDNNKNNKNNSLNGKNNNLNDKDTYKIFDSYNDPDLVKDSDDAYNMDERAEIDETDASGIVFEENEARLAKMEEDKARRQEELQRMQQDRSRAVVMEKLEGGFQIGLTVLPLIFIGVLIIAIIAQLALIGTARYQETQLLEEAKDLRYDLEHRIDEVNAEFVTDRVKKILKQSDLYLYTNSLWTYELSANGQVIKDSEITVKDDGGLVKIVLKEYSKDNPLPKDIIDIGMVTRGDKQDKIERHINVYSGQTTSSTEVLPKLIGEGHEKEYTFEVKDLKKGDSFILVISDQLGERIKMPFNEITVTIG